MNLRRAAFTLIEVALAIAIGLVLLGGTVAAYNSVRQSSNMSNARAMVGTIQTNIGMDKFRAGTPPPLTAPGANPPWPATCSVTGNMDSTGKPYWPNSPTAGQLPDDPVLGKHTILTFDSTQASVVITAGTQSDRWDNPCFVGAANIALGYGKGGWLYDTATGSFRINLSNDAYPGDKPGAW
ncbi:MAG: hypothetical protein JWM80_2009 [Cyanobacteria bacterium RYN_339]|nr:hypothetical protein [Cyanobacteria bacterium RYN_339]